MCGIAGIIAPNRSEHYFRIVDSALGVMSKRGPDSSGVVSLNDSAGGFVLFGHRRLAIIDLSSDGHQPMQSPDGRYLITFNGEILNYNELRSELKTLGCSFQTATDTEVLLTAWDYWGISALRKFKGMFAFAVYDNQENKVHLVRDAFGIKPIYFSMVGGVIYFASEIKGLKSLLQGEVTVNRSVCREYLLFGKYDHTQGTFYREIRSLRPGHFLELSVDQLTVGCSDIKVESWWNPSIEERKDLSFEEATSEVRRLFLSNIGLHLRSDVPVACALSGGVDSSAIACSIRYLEPDLPIHTYSYIPRGAVYNEEAWVDLINEKIQAKAHKILISESDFSEDYGGLLSAQDEPFMSTSVYAQYRVFESMASDGVKVSLDGQGADELFAGYDGYPHQYLQSLFESGKFSSAINYLNTRLTYSNSSASRLLFGVLNGLLPEKIYDTGSALRHRIGKRALIDVGISADFLRSSRRGLANQISSDSVAGRRLVSALRESFVGNGLPRLLRHADRNSMKWSVESRVPFLTTDLAELVLSLPEKYFVGPKGETKYIFRKAMEGIVPSEVLERNDKIGFRSPETGWLNTNMAWLDALRNSDMPIPGLDTEQALSSLAQIHESGRAATPLDWRIINLGLWSLGCSSG